MVRDHCSLQAMQAMLWYMNVPLQCAPQHKLWRTAELQHASCHTAAVLPCLTQSSIAGPRTPPSAFRLSNNRTQDPDEQLPDTPWQFFFWGSAEGCKFEGDWCLEGEHLFPNDKAWTNKRENKVTFEFEGSEVRRLLGWVQQQALTWLGTCLSEQMACQAVLGRWLSHLSVCMPVTGEQGHGDSGGLR